MTHNAECILRDVTLDGPSVWERFNPVREGVLRRYDGLAKGFSKACPSALVERLEHTVGLMATA